MMAKTVFGFSVDFLRYDTVSLPAGFFLFGHFYIA